MAATLFLPREAPPEAEMPPLTFDQAIHLLHRHKHEVRALGKRPVLPERVATPERRRRCCEGAEEAGQLAGAAALSHRAEARLCVAKASYCRRDGERRPAAKPD